LTGLAELVKAGGPTVLIAANRPLTVAFADNVLLLSAGRIAAAGSHEELLGNAEYRRIVTAYDRRSEVVDDERSQVG
jgi:ATP-binding cassette subfamily B protein